MTGTGLSLGGMGTSFFPLFNADGAAFRVPALPIEWNGGNIGEGLQVTVLGADAEAVRATQEK